MSEQDSGLGHPIIGLAAMHLVYLNVAIAAAMSIAYGL